VLRVTHLCLVNKTCDVLWVTGFDDWLSRFVQGPNLVSGQAMSYVLDVICN